MKIEKVSILMNCYNGEKYLEYAINSIYAQTFKDWKIIFIDNGSTDNSAEIVKKYDKQIDYYKIAKTISFGAARNYGFQLCKGRYVSFLDVDDLYFENTLQILIDEIEGSDYLLVYGGHENINSAGETIGYHVPSVKKGNIFRELLLQFDIPTASSIINLSRFRKSELSYDSKIFVSAEYCLFLQLSVNNKFKSIGGSIVKYRIHDASLTNKNLSHLYDDRVYTLNKIVLENVGISDMYVDEFKEAFARADYYKVKHLLFLNKKKEARNLLKKHMFQDVRYLALNLLLYLPSFLWSYILRKKYSR